MAKEEMTTEEVDSVEDSVAAAFDQLEEAEPETTEETEERTEAEEDAPAEEAADTGDEPEPVEEPDEPPAETAEEDEPEGVAEDGAPQHWSAEDREMYATLPDDAKQFIERRHKEMEADYTRKTQDISDLKREYEPVDQMMRAFAPALQSQGIGPGEMIRRWAQAESYLNSNPVQAIKQLMTHYGVDETALSNSPAQSQDPYFDGQQEDQPYHDPQVQSLQQQVSNLTTQQKLQEINAFAEQVDSQGNKLHPYFDEVMGVIAQDHRAARAIGMNPTLEELYEQACWKTPTVREKLNATQATPPATPDVNEKAKAEQAAAEARQKAARARKANRSISGEGGAATEAPPVFETVEEAAEAAYDKHSH